MKGLFFDKICDVKMLGTLLTPFYAFLNGFLADLDNILLIRIFNEMVLSMLWCDCYN